MIHFPLFRAGTFHEVLWILALSVVLSGCDEGPLGGGGDKRDVTRYLSSGFAVSDAQQQTYLAVVRSEGIPRNGTEEFPTLSYGEDTITSVRGGSVMIGLDSPTPIRRIFVGVEGQRGSYEIDLSGSQVLPRDADGATSFSPAYSQIVARVEYLPPHAAGQYRANHHVDLVLSIPEDGSLDNFDLSLAVEYALGGAGLSTTAAPVSRVKTASISLLDDGVSRSLSFAIQWGPSVDVDLHVVTPSGTRIGYDTPRGDGGVLSVDTNAGCLSNPGTTEKIEWSADAAPRAGIYRAGPNYYQACGGFAGEVPVVLTVNNGRVQGVYRVVLRRSDANRAPRLDPDKITYTAVLAPKDTDQGLLARLLINENPPPGVVPAEEVKRGMEAVRALVNNRLASKNRQITGAPADATLRQIITAKNQFQGFSGGMDKKTEQTVDQRLVAFSSQQGLFRPYWENLFSVLNGPVNDPFAGIKKVGDVEVKPGVWGMYATSDLKQRPKGPGGAFIGIPAAQGGVIAGNQYYTLPLNF